MHGVTTNIRLITISLEESFFWQFNVADENKNFLGVHLLCQILNKFEVRQVFVKVPDIKFHANPSSGSRADIRRETDGRTRTGVMKVISSFSGVGERV